MRVAVCLPETKAYQPIPEIIPFLDGDGNDTMHQEIDANYRQIKVDVENVVLSEMVRIQNDPSLEHLVKKDRKKG